MTRKQGIQSCLLVTMLVITQCMSVVQSQQQYMNIAVGGEGDETFDGNVPVAAVNPTSQQYIRYNRATIQTQQQRQQQQQQYQQQPVNQNFVVDPGQNMNLQNVRQQQYLYHVNQPQAGGQQQQQQQQQQQLQKQQPQQQQQHQQQPLSDKLFPVSNVPKQQQHQRPIINKNFDNNNNKLIANGNSLSTLPSSVTLNPLSSISLPASSVTVTNPFQPLLPIGIIDDVRNEDNNNRPQSDSDLQTEQCVNCCEPQQNPCTSCCDSSPFLNSKTLQTLAG